VRDEQIDEEAVGPRWEGAPPRWLLLGFKQRRHGKERNTLRSSSWVSLRLGRERNVPSSSSVT
jgi:hypothetical protein